MNDKYTYQQELYSRAVEAWNNLDTFREDRERNKRYLYGYQWDDIIDVDGIKMTEEAYIRSQGSVPLKNNLIRRLVRNVLGVWRNEFKLPRCKMRDAAEYKMAELVNKLLECNSQTNRLPELYARTMEEFLVSGMAVHRKSFSKLRGRAECLTEYVHPCKFFFATDGCDFRGWDLTMLGEMHTTTFGSALRRFGDGRIGKAELAEALGLGIADESAEITIAEVWQLENESYMVWHDREGGHLVRVPESSGIQPPEDAEVRHEYESVWRYYFLGTDGLVLKSGISPYSHREHPYVVKFYPYVDGEIHSFVADVIDQQRYTNRLITLYDWVMRASAKGVLLFPEGSLPEDADLQEVADEWSRFNGVISYKAKPGLPAPVQVNSTASYAGITDLLNIQLKMFEDISGVNAALQGKLESSSVSGTLFSQQTQNAMTSLRDLIESYREFVVEATMKDACNLLHFYTPERMAQVAGVTSADMREVDLSRFYAPEQDFAFR